MSDSFEYPDTFYQVAQNVLSKHPQLKHQWSLNEKKRRRELLIPKIDASGFDVGVTCETYGLYPWAGDWCGPCWDVVTPDTTLLKMSEEVVGLLRILLSPESRIRTVWRGDRKFRLSLEFATSSGWHLFDKHFINPFAWFGEKREVDSQNCHLVRRNDFDGANPLWCEVYKWEV